MLTADSGFAVSGFIAQEYSSMPPHGIEKNIQVNRVFANS